MQKHSKIYIAGHNGMVGSSIMRNLLSNGYTNIITSPYPPYDLTDQKIVADFFEKAKPEYVFLAAAKVGGIVANNKYRAQFIYENTMIQNNIIHQSYKNGVKKLLFLGSSCIYPRDCPQPIKEEYLLSGELEYTNEPYAIAKIAGIKMCESYNLQYGTNFISVMPTNLYGPNDNYNLETSHVLPALIRKMHLGKCLGNNDWKAIRKDLKKYPVEGINDTSGETEILNILSKYGIKLAQSDKRGTINDEPATRNPQPVTITLWGTGSPYREFLYVDDLAVACVFVMNNVDFKDLAYGSSSSAIRSQSSSPAAEASAKAVPPHPLPHTEIKNTHINIGTGKDLTIKKSAELIQGIVGFTGKLEWDSSKPDGTPRKLLDVAKINALGWKEKVSLKEGIGRVYEKYGCVDE
jgi:GDP-L-fucose synthase